MLSNNFFNRDAQAVAKSLLGKVIHRKYKNQWLRAQIIETEAYYLREKGSHASLGYTEKRKALFMPAGTIYMYYARGGDSLNISTKGKGNAVLIKSAIADLETLDTKIVNIMHQLNPVKNTNKTRKPEKLCSGQTLLCRALALKVPEWDQKTFNPEEFYIANNHYQPEKIIQTTRLGIPKGRDEHLPYRFIDAKFLAYCTQGK